MTEGRDQRSAVRNQRVEIKWRDAQGAELFLCALCAFVLKPISDLRLLIAGLCALLLVLSLPAVAYPANTQQAGKISRIGFLSPTASEHPSRIGAFGQGLRELGYFEGKNIIIEYRYAEGRPDRLSTLAAELVKL